MSFWSEWRAERELRSRAEAYARAAWADPAVEDVRWLATEATGGDEDHARWELRYLRRALSLLVAERDALDDRTGSAVARVLGEMLRRDRSVAAERLHVAERQFTSRLGRYRETLRERGHGAEAARLGAALVSVAAGSHAPARTDPRARDVVEAYLQGAQTALRATFEIAQLPEDVRPSQAVPGAHRR